MAAATHDTNTNDGIAVIGMAGRFPGARSVDQFWDNLQRGVESISVFSDDEQRAAGVPDALLADPRFVKAAGVLDDIELFDAEFFGFTPREAEIMDPQHRVFLECAWEALESAGYDSARYDGLIGVYAGMGLNAYVHNVRSNVELARSIGRFHVVIANDKDFLTTRVSYKLNLRGPSVSVQSACSTSLVAVHLARKSLLASECDIALAGGVSIGIPHAVGHLYQEGGVLSSDGHCKAFAAGSDGFVGGSGVAIVVLKRLGDALADRDCIHAVIRGSAINNDGSLKVGYTAPSVEGQSHVIRAAHAAAGITADTIGYVEAHGTGTPLGDPVEIAALTHVFRETTSARQFCAVGSVKTSIGHLDAAAGVTSLIKTALCLRHGKIVPSLHCDRPNPHIDFASSPFYVNTTLKEWSRGAAPRRAGVNSLGLGGTNAHVIVEEAPAIETVSVTHRHQLLVLSARSSTALAASSDRLARHLRSDPSLELADVAYTLQVGRRPLAHRLVTVCDSAEEVIQVLERSGGRCGNAPDTVATPSIAFMFPGGGAHHVNMGAGLYRHEPVFRQHVDRCLELLSPELGVNLRKHLYPAPGREADASQALQHTGVALPALFITEYALARLWMAWGIRPAAMIGHSLGEYVAACVSGVFSLPDALTLVVRRGQLLERIAPGAMLSVPIDEATLAPLLGGEVSIAAINAPSLCVVSGPVDAIADLERELDDRDIESHRVHIAVGAHSPLVEPILDTFRQFLQKLSLYPPTIPFVSNVTGTWITERDATSPDYWVRHIRQTVRFADGVKTLVERPVSVLLEIGPGRTLGSLPQADAGHAPLVVSSMRHPRDPDVDTRVLLNAVGQLWLASAEIDWDAMHGDERPRRVPLPTYPFERKRFWVDVPARSPAPRGGGHPRASSTSPTISQRVWRHDLVPRTVVTDATERGRRCLLFSDGGAFTEKLASRLHDAGYLVTTVVVGDGYGGCAPSVYAIHPRRPDDYTALVSQLRASIGLPEVVIHAWSIGDRVPGHSSRAWFDECQERGYYNLLFLARALEEVDARHDLRIVVLSTHLHDVDGDGTACPERSTLLAPCQTIPQEHANITCRIIDIVTPESGSWREDRLLDRLLAEVRDGGPVVVAYRGNRRLVQSFEPVPIRPSPSPSMLRESGVYLITGGLGRLGLIVARHLAKAVHARLALVGRSAFPRAEDWDAWVLAHPADESTTRTIRTLQEIVGLGAQVLVVTADVGDASQMRAAVDLAYDTFGDLHGVIHAAGVTKGSSVPRPVVDTGIDESDEQFRPKVDGVYALERALAGRHVDFCALFSSIAGVLGGLGLSAYAAANLFMDAFAVNRAARGTRWLSLGWELWSPEDGEAKGLGSAARYAMSVDAGVRAFDLALSAVEAGHVVVSSGELDARLEQWVDRKLPPSPDGVRRPLGHARPSVSTVYRAPQGEREEALAEVWQELLGIDRVGADDNFFELGGHSLLATRVVARLRETLRMRVPLRRLFELPTITKLAASLEDLQERTALGDASIGRIERHVAPTPEQLDRLSDAEADALLAQLLAARQMAP